MFQTGTCMDSSNAFWRALAMAGTASAAAWEIGLYKAGAHTKDLPLDRARKKEGVPFQAR
jgi:hypothetical protein